VATVRAEPGMIDMHFNLTRAASPVVKRYRAFYRFSSRPRYSRVFVLRDMQPTDHRHVICQGDAKTVKPFPP
jgi:hypothetical protein